MLSTAPIDWIKKRALEITAELDAKSGPYRAEILPDTSATWHLVRTAPADENRAAKFLVQRGFGVYLPMLRSFPLTRDGAVNRMRIKEQLFFPGYLFLFVWDVKAHWRRIKACPGVHTVVCIDERPIIVPFPIIDHLQGLEVWQDQTVDYGLPQAEPVKAPRRKWRRTPNHVKEQRAQQDDGNVIVTVSTRGYLREMADVDSTVRIGALHRALGLVS